MNEERYAIIGTINYGLYAGIVDSIQPDPGTSTMTVTVRQCRHIPRWFGRTGGITSLAVYGICGPRAGESRIGAPAPQSTISGVRAIHDCTPEARATLEATVQR